MKAITKTVYEAHDGKTFDTAEECKAHERLHAADMLVGRTESDIHAALNRENPSLADAIERVAYLIANRRKEQGEVRRRRKPAAKKAGSLDDVLERGAASEGEAYSDDPGVQAAAEMAQRERAPQWPDPDAPDREQFGAGPGGE